MSTLNRFNRLIKAYMNDMYDRIREIDRERAQAELDQSRFQSGDYSVPSSERPSSAYPSSTSAQEQKKPPREVVEAYKLLGVEEGCDFAIVRAAYFKLVKRADPERFDTETTERTQAQEIRQRVDAAYETLRQALDPGSSRFRQLEIE